MAVSRTNIYRQITIISSNLSLFFKSPLSFFFLSAYFLLFFPFFLLNILFLLIYSSLFFLPYISLTLYFSPSILYLIFLFHFKHSFIIVLILFIKPTLCCSNRFWFKWRFISSLFIVRILKKISIIQMAKSALHFLLNLH